MICGKMLETRKPNLGNPAVNAGSHRAFDALHRLPIPSKNIETHPNLCCSDPRTCEWAGSLNGTLRIGNRGCLWLLAVGNHLAPHQCYQNAHPQSSLALS